MTKVTVGTTATVKRSWMAQRETIASLGIGFPTRC